MEVTIGGGEGNVATCHAAVCGGRSNHAVGGATFIGGGYANVCTTGSYSAIAGGEGDTMWGHHSAIPGGRKNIVNGDYSLAFGEQVVVSGNHVTAFYDAATTAGKVGINEPSPDAELHVNGTVKITQILHLEPISFPGSGEKGDIYYDEDIGKLRVCTVSGTPGTWETVAWE